MSNAAPIVPKYNHASSMIVEDHLKKILTMTNGRAWHFTDNTLLPRSQHSCFGDFPKEYMKGIGKGNADTVPKIENAQASIAASGRGKSPTTTHARRNPQERPGYWWQDHLAP